EMFWVKHQHVLTGLGCMLRPRYHPDWTPSWVKKDGTERVRLRRYLDSHVPLRVNVMDAIRLKDGTKVVLQVTRTDTNELSMIKKLCNPREILQDPLNHTVPIIETVPIPDDNDHRVFMVMLILRNFSSPAFHCRSEFVEAFRQLLEVVTAPLFTSACHPSDDVNIMNFLMDASGVCPRGYHFAQNVSYDGVHWSLYDRPRCRVAPVRYYLIDFDAGISRRQR
ncbi:hypothetical protein F5146DRAFT_928526, partial [Armillaria mellea]